ncbi:polyketide synthase [Aspergillus heteromorphus CBS 117.55]|uniref:Polyketide synthase n=1 Tax=Aspergillus heteromorphus CBS 117.55 TaxID=1448321 RepID=A0A317WJS8_9EURO|nr:polyketide synthase [Aspergillus heteromorphus CBS 117.55]PWY86696.1 polyketide synthase [Aspergillus heteromorphus CBS 117.55]
MAQPVNPARQNEPIAIVGIGCRLPGNVSSPAQLWDFLIQNRTGHCHVPKDRYNAEPFYHPDSDKPGSINSTGGYFIQEDIRAFDNAFFGINNAEAKEMDAQQRKLLEVVYEALENAGLPLEHVQGSDTGVFVGNFANEHMLMQCKDPEYLSRYSATGSSLAILANRITHCFDLHGPSLVVDTACSGSLHALHLACLALDAHDCSAAVVASANLIQSPEQQMNAVKAGILSPDSVSHTFDDSANGYGRAEAVSAVYLKRLGDAVRDRDPIRSVIKGTAINGNGRTLGIMQPCIERQQDVFRAAYRRAGLETNETDFIEAHGTGTKVGDPMEVNAISGVFDHITGRPTLVGGIKPSLGHSEAASGLTSVIKITLALENRILPATVGVENINPEIHTREWNVDIVTKNMPWPQSATPRAGVNASGFGGSNSHAILEAAKLPSRDSANGSHSMTEHATSNGNLSNTNYEEHKQSLILLSAKSEASLTGVARNLAAYTVTDSSQFSLDDLAYTLGCRRSRHPIRGFLLESQSNLRNGFNVEMMRVPETGFSETLPFAFIYTGQGAQWAGMGVQLIRHNTVFRETIQYLDDCLHALDFDDAPSWTIEATLLTSAAESDINLAEKSQPLCTAVQIALTDLLHDWGISPKIVLGHSSGELAAAYATGFLTAREAILASYFRGIAVCKCSLNGAMVTVQLDRSEAQLIIEELSLQESIQVACMNSPESTTISGDEVAIDDFARAARDRRMWARKLKTGGKAYHSHHMSMVGSWYHSLLEHNWGRSSTFNEVINGTTHTRRPVTMVSTVTGEQVRKSEVAMPKYWRMNLESPVLFEDALRTILKSHNYHFIELGPHSAMRLPLEQTAISAGKSDYHYNSCLSRGKDSYRTILELVGSLFLRGHDGINYHNIFLDDSRREPQVCFDLPPYPWDYSSAAMSSTPRVVAEFNHRRYPRHELLGSQIPGGNPATLTWRNILDLNEIEWLSHHCLGPSPLFPATGYIAMAVEAMCQVAGLELEECPGVELRNLSFMKTLDMDFKRKPRVEIITDMRPTWISSQNRSGKWWEFSVTSVSESDSQSTLHMCATVSLSGEHTHTERRIHLDKSTMRQDASRVWYDRFTQEGLNWGPSFAVMKEIFRDPAMRAHKAAATTPLVHDNNLTSNRSLQYIAHPASIDGMFQTAFVATAGGQTSKLRGKVPVVIDSLYVAPPSVLDMTTENWSTDAVSEDVGFGTVIINSELYNSSGQVLVRMNNARCVAFQGKARTEAPRERNPLVRVAWKPDITALTSEDLSRYLDWFVNEYESRGMNASKRLLRLAGALDLACHRRPDSSILDLTGQDETADFMGVLLRAGSSLQRFSSYVKGVFSESGEILREGLTDEESERTPSDAGVDTFNIILVRGIAIATGDVPNFHSNAAIQDTQGLTIEFGSEAISATTKPRHVVMVGTPKHFLLSQLMNCMQITRDSRATGIELQIQDSLGQYFGYPVNIFDLSQVSCETVPDRSIIISTLEIGKPLLTVINERQMAFLKICSNQASIILWISNGDCLGGRRPESSPVLGLSRCLMLGQPSLQFAVLNVNDIAGASSGRISSNAVKILNQLLCHDRPEFEFCQREGMAHVPRWEPDESLNAKFRLKLSEETIEERLRDAGSCQLNIKNPGQMDTIHFVPTESSGKISAGDVEIDVKSVGMNAKDLYVITAKVDTAGVSCSCECAGVVTAVGEDVIDFKPGDRVVVMAPGHFATVERFPQWTVCKLHDDEDFITASTIPIAFSTVIYGLKHRANLKPGESVFIHSAAGGVGIAAIQYAKHLGAKVFATVGNQAKKDFLVAKFNLDPAHIFSSRDSSFLSGILKATSGRGVDVVLNSLTGELLHCSLEACAEFGRFVEIGKRDILDHGALDMAILSRNIAFIAFDLFGLYMSKRESHHRLWSSLLVDSMDLIRSDICQPCTPLRTFDVSEIVDAFRHLSLGSRMGKVAVSFQNEHSKIRIVPSKYKTRFSHQKTYLMVGCLGGLGRSLSRWMMSLGACDFVFLGRSGTDKREAKTLVDDLQEQGAHVTVVRGDVCIYEDVKNAIRSARLPIGGVIQAAMSVNESLWDDMSLNQWHATLGPKVQGTWNLHNALQIETRASELDFFVMTSSIAGTVGTATESNYCAANAFLDAFARYRNSLGLPAVSIGYGMISEVGYLHEHPQIQALLKRQGTHAITKEELLQIMDLAIAHQNPTTWESRYDHLAASHLLTGVEFTGLEEQRDRGFEKDNYILSDPRASLFATAFSRRMGGNSTTHPNSLHTSNNHLPAELKNALQESKHGSNQSLPILDALRNLVSRKLSNLILLPEGKLQPDQPLGDFGLDSMLAAEFRTFIFRTLGVDVPFVALLDRGATVDVLAGLIAEGLSVDGYESGGL